MWISRLFSAHIPGGLSYRFIQQSAGWLKCEYVASGKQKEEIKDPLKLLLPEVICDYFELVHTELSDKEVHLFLDEQHIPPKTAGYESKGFTEQSIIQDFPLRGKPVYLHIRRRKWLEKGTNKVITNSYDLTHLGTQITAEFAVFLKGIYRE